MLSRRLVVLLLGVTLGLTGLEPVSPATAAPVRTVARIVRVVDGDTVLVSIDGGEGVYVRVLGIDTPEVFGTTECGGAAASRMAERLLPEDTRVVLVSDPTQALKDRYGRLLRYVMKGHTDIGKVQVRRGMAKVYVYHHHPFRRTPAYRAAQADAARHDRGSWKTCW